MSKSIGRIVGTVGGALVGGPAGASVGYNLGSAIDKPNPGAVTTTTAPNVPGYISSFQQDLFNRSQNAANSLGVRQYAGFSPLQQQGFDALSNLNSNAGMGAAQNALSRFGAMQFGAERINPMMVNGQGYGIERAQAGNFLTGNIGAYMNPYTSAVIDQSMSDIDRARQLQQQQVNSQALSRGAFGGSRQAIAEAENNRNFMDQQARTIAGLRQQGFDTAAGLMQQDLNRDANISQFNAGNQTNANQFLAGAMNQANLANQSAGLTAASQNANNQLQAQQLGLVANEAALTGGLNFNRSFLGNSAAMLDAGAQQQLLAQQRMDAERNAPLERLQILQSTLGNGQLPTGSTVSRPLYANNTNSLLGSIGTFAASNPQAVSSATNFLTGIFGGNQPVYQDATGAFQGGGIGSGY